MQEKEMSKINFQVSLAKNAQEKARIIQKKGLKKKVRRINSL